MIISEFLTALRKINNKDALLMPAHTREANRCINIVGYTKYTVELDSTARSTDYYDVRKLVKRLLNLSPNKVVCIDMLSTMVEVERVFEEGEYIILDCM